MFETASCLILRNLLNNLPVDIIIIYAFKDPEASSVIQPYINKIINSLDKVGI